MSNKDKSGSKKGKVIAAIPAFNEEKYIGDVVKKTLQYVDEVIVADDGSADKTAEIAQKAGANVISHTKNSGYGASIKTLFAEARKRNAEIMVLLDGDSQHNPDDIPAMINPLSKGFDIVIGSREQKKQNIPRYRRFGQQVIARASHILSGQNLTDSESGFRAFSKRAIDSLDMQENGMAISAETIFRASEKGLKITETPIDIKYTEDGSTLNPVAHGLGVLSRITVMIAHRRPLLFFGTAGIIVAAAGAITRGANSTVGNLLILVGILVALSGLLLISRKKRKV